MNSLFVPQWRSMVIGLCTLTTASCSLSDTGPSTYLPPDQFLAVFSLEHHAINLSMVAPYDTVTLQTTQLMADGRVASGEVIYSVSSPSLSVHDGVLKAESAVTRAVVRAKFVHGTVTRIDSAIVSVIAGAPDHIRDFGIRVSAGDSAKNEAGKTKTIPLIRESESGSTLSSLAVSLVSSDTTVASAQLSGNAVQIRTIRPGRVMLSASTFAYGVEWRDSLVFTSGWPLQFIVPVVERFTAGSTTKRLDFAYQDFTIGVGGCVIWENQNETADIDVHFDDSLRVGPPIGTDCGQWTLELDVGGNIAPFRRLPWDGTFENISAIFSGWKARAFRTPGVFPFRMTLHDTGGRVRVCDERNDTSCAPGRLGSWY